jgi:tetratricopeptide (TPR) repeat protein
VRAKALLDESEARFEAAGDDAGLSTVAVRRAYTSLAERDLVGAKAHLERALALRAGLSDRRGRGLVLSGLGLVETIAGEYGRAERYLGEARDIFRRAGDRWGLASTLWRTADLAIARGRLDDAEAALTEALSVLGETQRQRWLASTLAGLGEVAALRGDHEEAVRLLLDARDRYASREDALGVATLDERLRSLAKEPLRPGKGAPDTPVRQAKTKGRRT